MAKSSKIYWAARQRQLNKALQKAEKDLTKRLSAFYSKESAKLDKEIAAYYAELGEDNVVEYRKMLQHMSDADRKLLMERMDDFAKKYPEKAHLMPTRASIYKLDRLEGLQTSTKLHQMEIGAVTEEEVTKHLKQTAVRSANAAAETLTGKGGSLYELNSPLVEKIIGTNWANGISYSERIWKNTEKLADKLNSDIAAGFVRGDSYDKLSKRLMTEMNIRNRSDAERLIYTEGTHVMNEASISVFQEAGFDQYIISPLPDCCEFCQSVADEQNAIIERDRSAVFIQDRQAGMNFPPFHPWCRCSYEIYLPETREQQHEYNGDKALEPMETLYKHSEITERARNITNVDDLRKVSDSSIINMQSHDEIANHFKENYDIKITNFEKVDLDSAKITLCGVDDVLTKLTEAKDGITEIAYNARSSGYGVLDRRTGRMVIGRSGINSYGTGVHEAIHAYDNTKSYWGTHSYADEIVNGSIANLKLTSKRADKLKFEITLDKNEAKKSYELLSYAMETEFSGAKGNILSKEIFRMVMR